MPLRLAYTRPDGGVSIVNAAPFETLAIKHGERVAVVTDDGGKGVSTEFTLWSREAYVARVTERSVPKDAVGIVELPDDWAPPHDRTFRDAWVLSDTAVTVHMPKARDIHRERLRALRKPKLEALDTEYQRADEAGDTKAKAVIAKRKKALRDVTDDPAIEAAETPEQLAAVIPDALRV